MRETLVDFLRGEQGYHIIEKDNAKYLLRPNSSIAAKMVDDKWVTDPTQDEMIRYSRYSGRGYPSMLCDGGSDLTNGPLPKPKT